VNAFAGFANPRPPSHGTAAEFEIGLQPGASWLTIIMPGASGPATICYRDGGLKRVSHTSKTGLILLAAATGGSMPPNVLAQDLSRARGAIKITCGDKLMIVVNKSSARFSRPVKIAPNLAFLLDRATEPPKTASGSE
jgi:hypothetical protein